MNGKKLPYRGKPRFFDKLPPKEKKAVVSLLFWLNKIRKYRPFRSYAKYHEFFKFCYFSSGFKKLTKEYLNLSQFELFCTLMYSNKSTAEKLELLKLFKNNEIVEYALKALYDPYTFNVFNSKYFFKITKHELIPELFVANITHLYEMFNKFRFNTNTSRKMLITYYYYYKRYYKYALHKFCNLDGFICCKRNSINEYFGKNILNSFEIRKHISVENKDLLNTLGNVQEYYVAKRPIGLPAYWIFDSLGEQHIYSEGNIDGNFVSLSKAYNPLVFDTFKIDLNNVVFEIIISTIDDDGKTRQITSQYLNNKRKILLFKLTNIQIGIYDVYTLKEYIQGKSDLTYSERLENLKKIFEYYKFDNINILDVTKIKDLNHLLSIAQYSQKRDGEDMWDGLQFIKDEPFCRNGKIIDLYTRTSEPRKPASYRKDRAGLQNK